MPSAGEGREGWCVQHDLWKINESTTKACCDEGEREVGIETFSGAIPRKLARWRSCHCGRSEDDEVLGVLLFSVDLKAHRRERSEIYSTPQHLRRYSHHQGCLYSTVHVRYLAMNPACGGYLSTTLWRLVLQVSLKMEYESIHSR